MINLRRLYDLCNDPDRLREFAKHPVGARSSDAAPPVSE
jgi:hypothetical protein